MVAQARSLASTSRLTLSGQRSRLAKWVSIHYVAPNRQTYTASEISTESVRTR